MRYSRKRDNTLRSKVRRSKYPSRAAIRTKAKVGATVRKFSKGLGELPEDLRSSFGQFYPGKLQVEDEYYVKEAFPPRDVMTESGLGGFSGKHVLKGFVAGAALWALCSYITR
jgi:hypothetical protein